MQAVRAAEEAVGTPAYVYDASTLAANAEACLAFPNAYGLTVRYAMKSLPNKAVLQLFDRCTIRGSPWHPGASAYIDSTVLRSWT